MRPFSSLFACVKPRLDIIEPIAVLAVRQDDVLRPLALLAPVEQGVLVYADDGGGFAYPEPSGGFA
jgi:hypothetical protein